MEQIQPLPVERDENGFWCHPCINQIPEETNIIPWLQLWGLEYKLHDLESEPIDHPVYVSYFEEENPDINGWKPQPPKGEGWFTLAIYDTEDGPQWLWVRPKQ